jgi:hypothetical protein
MFLGNFGIDGAFWFEDKLSLVKDKNIFGQHQGCSKMVEEQQKGKRKKELPMRNDTIVTSNNWGP